MALLLFLAFIVVPLIELAVILQVGSYLGAWPTVVILLADSVAGAWLVKREGRRAWNAFRTALSAGRWPGDEVAQGALVLIGGALLLTPGFVTDGAGLLMVLPPTRALASRGLRGWLKPTSMKDAQELFDRKEAERRSQEPSDNGTSTQGEVIDVEVISVERNRDRPGTGDN